MTTLQVGQPAPAFQGVDQNGNHVQLSDFQGKKVVLYFYPKDDTPGCTAEACDFRDNHDRLIAHGIHVIGVSADSAKSHLKFADKYRLNFPLIADEDRRIIEAYGVWGKKKFMGREYDGIHRETFVIDEHGHLAAVLTKVDTKASTAQILSSLGIKA
ncbi:thioredoxin-dependent thiol peroxidase [bacterium]|nr:thioredoxin-dependent thiol peroxidase [bacterium]